MDVSIFLAKLFGLYFLVVGGFSLLRKKAFVSMIDEFFASKALLAMSGFISLSIGLAVVVGHRVYEFDWRGLITLIGYLAIVKGIMRVWYPDTLRSFAHKCVHKHYTAMIVTILFFGCFFALIGFVYK